MSVTTTLMHVTCTISALKQWKHIVEVDHNFELDRPRFFLSVQNTSLGAKVHERVDLYREIQDDPEATSMFIESL